jgi:hypothetical protein
VVETAQPYPKAKKYAFLLYNNYLNRERLDGLLYHLIYFFGTTANLISGKSCGNLHFTLNYDLCIVGIGLSHKSSLLIENDVIDKSDKAAFNFNLIHHVIENYIIEHSFSLC